MGGLEKTTEELNYDSQQSNTDMNYRPLEFEDALTTTSLFSNCINIEQQCV
jgi:hypothetical protein